MHSTTNFKLQNYLSLGNHPSEQKNGKNPHQQQSQANALESLRKEGGREGANKMQYCPVISNAQYKSRKKASHTVAAWPADNLSSLPWSCD